MAKKKIELQEHVVWALLQLANSGAESGDKVWLKTRMEIVCTVLIYHSVKKSNKHMLWCSKNSSDGAVGAYTPQNHEGMETDDLSANDNNFTHYVLW